MGIEANQSALNALSKNAQRVSIADSDSQLVAKVVGDASIVLLGEASHGTQEFYESRAAISRRLIVERGFNVIAIEADWPDAYYLNRYVRGELGDAFPNVALSQFKRFPQWMWRNQVVADFIIWLKAYNDPLPQRQRVGIYGLDLYSLYHSIAAVIHYLDKVDSIAAKIARERYSCFNGFSDPQQYGYSVRHDLEASCLKVVLEQLADLQKQSERYLVTDEYARESYFYAEQNAILIKNAERYYRMVFKNDASSWNVRDKHMADTLDSIMQHMWHYKHEPKAIVWAHNTHIGNASATQMSEYGEINLGQLLRERYGEKVFSVGYSTYQGKVRAATDWGGANEIKTVRNALPNSYEALFHELGVGNFLLDIKNNQKSLSFLVDYLQRAIGVVYRPDTERYSHYYYADLLGQFDALLHFDKTNALQTLEFETESTSNNKFALESL